ncbi:MAG: hypothetical protein RR767_05530 [Acinetobacter sp.]
MKKIIYLVVLLVGVWLVKLSFNAIQSAQAIDQLQQQLINTEQRSVLLNDQLVALQRQLQQGNHDENVHATTALPAPMTGIAPALLIQTQLQLVQFALDQQQYIYALDHLHQVQQNLPQSHVAVALQRSLNSAIAQDKQAIQQYILTQTQQQQQFDQLLQQLDQKLQQNLQSPKLNMPKTESATGWHWFKLEKIQRTPPDFMQRNIALKEIQLRLLLASQALHAGQQQEYRQSVQEVIQLLAQLPDRDSQQIKLQLEKLANLPVASAPKLITLGLLGASS